MMEAIGKPQAGGEYIRQTCEGMPASSDVQATESVVPTKRLDVSKLIPNGNVNVVWASANGEMPSPTEVFLGLMQQKYDALKSIIDNLKPSDREKENLRRKLEEIKELREQLLTRKIDLEEARRRFVNLLDPEDVAELGKLADREAWKIMG